MQPPVSCLHMLKVVKGLKVRGWEFARHWVDELPPRIIIVGMHWKTLSKGWQRCRFRWPRSTAAPQSLLPAMSSKPDPHWNLMSGDVSMISRFWWKATIYNLWKTLLWQARVVSAAQMNTNYLSYKLHSLNGIVSFLLCFLCTVAVVICDVVRVQCWIAVVFCTPRVYHKRLKQ